MHRPSVRRPRLRRHAGRSPDSGGERLYLGGLPQTPSGVLWASDDTLEQLHRLIRVHLAVRRAVRLNKISVAFQPIVDTAGRMWCGRGPGAPRRPGAGPGFA